MNLKSSKVHEPEVYYIFVLLFNTLSCRDRLYFLTPYLIFCIFVLIVGVFIAGVVLHHVAPIDAIFPAALHETRPRLLTAKERERKKEEKPKRKEREK